LIHETLYCVVIYTSYKLWKWSGFSGTPCINRIQSIQDLLAMTHNTVCYMLSQNCCTIDYNFNVSVKSPLGLEVGRVAASTGNRIVPIDYTILAGNINGSFCFSVLLLLSSLSLLLLVLLLLLLLLLLLSWVSCLINLWAFCHAPWICNFINSLISRVHSFTESYLFILTTLHYSKIPLRLICFAFFYFDLFIYIIFT